MKNKTIFIGLGIVAVAGLGFYLWNKSKGAKTSSADGDYSENESSANGKSYNPLQSSSSLGDAITIDKIKESIKVLGKDKKINELILQDISNFVKNLKDATLAKAILEFSDRFRTYSDGMGNPQAKLLRQRILDYLSQYTATSVSSIPKGTLSSSSSSSDSGIVRKIEKNISALGLDTRVNSANLSEISKLAQMLRDSNLSKAVISFVESFFKGGNTTSTMQSQSLIANTLKFLSKY